MAEFTLTNFMIGLTLISMIAGGIILVYGDISANYHVTVDNSLNETYNRIKENENSTLEIADIVKKDQGTFDTFFLAGKTILQVPKLIMDSLGTVTKLVYYVALDIGIAKVFQEAAIGIITILVAMGAIGLWARYKNP